MEKKANLVLKLIDIDKIHKLYNIGLVSNINAPVNGSDNITTLSDLSRVNNEPSTITIIDEFKKKNRYIVSWIDIASQMELEDSTNKRCFWCRNHFSTIPIGCPVRYFPTQIQKSYHSEITKDIYNIKENISDTQCKYIDNYTKGGNINVNIHKKGYYEVDGVFCSFNCCTSFIHDNKSNKLYMNSVYLLQKLYIDLFNRPPVKFTPAPSWRLLKEYGGHFSIEQFRGTFNTVEYSYKDFFRNIKSIAHIFEEKKIN
jgi:hypothetical protein